MNLFETLRELKKIEPDPIFSENSRRVVLAHTPTEPLLPRRIFARLFAATGALVLAGILIFIIAGGLSTTKLAPQFSSIDPTALRAEAQAVDTQINLLNINYVESAEEPASTETGLQQPIMINATSSLISTTSTSTTTPNLTSTSTMSVDEVLQGLSQ